MKKFPLLLFSKEILLAFMFICLVQGLVLPSQLETYRFSEQEYLYDYGNLISKGLVYVAFTLSFFYPLIVWIKHKPRVTMKHKITMTLGFAPALYFIMLSVLSS